MSGVSCVVLTSASLICWPVQSGCSCATSAAVPATCGVAIEVPLIDTYEPEPGEYCDRAARMSTPGAVSSGFRPPSPRRGPQLENQARLSLESTAPTVSAAEAAPGEPMPPGPVLPAAMTNSAPVEA